MGGLRTLRYGRIDLSAGLKKKFNTKLFSEGAEFLVLSKLLLARIETYKAYENQEGYDLIAINAKKNLSAKIQVKSKNFKGDSSFYLNKDYKTKSDFYVFAQTNSLTRDYKVITDSESRPSAAHHGKVARQHGLKKRCAQESMPATISIGEARALEI